MSEFNIKVISGLLLSKSQIFFAGHSRCKGPHIIHQGPHAVILDPKEDNVRILDALEYYVAPVPGQELPTGPVGHPQPVYHRYHYNQLYQPPIP